MRNLARFGFQNEYSSLHREARSGSKGKESYGELQAEATGTFEERWGKLWGSDYTWESDIQLRWFSKVLWTHHWLQLIWAILSRNWLIKFERQLRRIQVWWSFWTTIWRTYEPCGQNCTTRSARWTFWTHSYTSWTHCSIRDCQNQWKRQ